MSDYEFEARLRSVETSLTQLLTSFQSEFGSGERRGHLVQRLEDIHQDLEQITSILVGTQDTPGLVTRVDRLERSESRRDRREGAAFTVLLGMAMKMVWDLIFGS